MNKTYILTHYPIRVHALAVLVILLGCPVFLAGFPFFSQYDTEENWTGMEPSLFPSPGVYAFSISPLAGFLYGQSEEIVYKEKEADSDTYLSQLLWDMKPLLYYGLELEFSRVDPMGGFGFFVKGSLKSALPFFAGRTGVMEDRDWRNHEQLTDFSISDNYTEGTLLADVSLGISVPLFSTVLLSCYLPGFSFMYFSWTAKDGYGESPPGSTPKIFSGEVLHFSQEWWILSAGLSLDFPLGTVLPGVPFFNRCSLGGFVQAGLVLYYEDEDNHLIAKTQYKDTASFHPAAPVWPIMLEGGLELVFSPHRRIDIAVHGSYRHISGVRGYCESRYPTGQYETEWTDSPNSTGAGYVVWDAGLSVRTRF
jgi:outer membrane protease